ncbi:MAG: hypothetical protein ACYCYN_11365 [Solirubrobacteraceae bacterium]
MFETTFINASLNRYATSSIVTGVTLSALTSASDTPAWTVPDRFEATTRADSCESSAVAIGRRSCHAV